jgi:hypothetical protein
LTSEDRAAAIEDAARRLLSWGEGVPSGSKSNGIGRWLQAALEDGGVCNEFQDDVRAWFKACDELTKALEK